MIPFTKERRSLIIDMVNDKYFWDTVLDEAYRGYMDYFIHVESYERYPNIRVVRFKEKEYSGFDQRQMNSIRDKWVKYKSGNN